MNVVFDGAGLGDTPITGVGRSFLNGLAAYAAQFQIPCMLLVPRGTAPPTIAGLQVVQSPRGALRRQLALPRLLRALRAAVLHSSVAAVPLRASCPTIATVHDLPWLHPESGERATPWRRFATRAALRAATAVIAPSRFTLAAVRSLLGSDEKLHHIPHGIDGSDDGDGIVLPDAAPQPTRFGPFLVLGDDRPRKNRDRVAAAHALATQRRPDLPPLQFVGPPHDWVDETEKRRLLAACCAVVQCSLFEGFGMPVLEAMAHGAPLVCSDIPPFREIAEQAAVFVDPLSIEAIAAGLLQVAPPQRNEARILAGRRCARTLRASATAARWHALHRSLAPR